MYGASTVMRTRNGGKRCLFCRRTLLLVFTFVFIELSVDVSGKVYPSVQWSRLNRNFEEPVFQLNVLPMSKLTILCPHRAMVLQTRDKEIPKEQLFENLWIVDNASFTSCNVNTNNTLENKLVLKCDKPSQLLFYQLLFQKFSAFADDLVFLPGNTYYFISTSDGFQNSLDSTSKGHCLSTNMKMAIYVCKDSQDPRCSEIQPTPSFPGTLKLEMVPEKHTTIKLVNTTGTSSPPILQKSTQMPFDPYEQEPAGSTGERKEDKDSYSLLEIVLIGLVVALCLILVSVVFYYERIKGKSLTKKPTKFDRVDSRAPALANGQCV